MQAVFILLMPLLWVDPIASLPTLRKARNFAGTSCRLPTRCPGRTRTNAKDGEIGRRRTLASMLPWVAARRAQARELQNWDKLTRQERFDATVKAFERGDYDGVKSMCERLVEEDSTLGYAWSLLGTAELILGSRNLTMSGSPTDGEQYLLVRAVRHFDMATSIVGKDAITTNNKANALGLLGDWDGAIRGYEEAFQTSLDTRMKDFEVIPMMNKALALFEIQKDKEAEQQLHLTSRRHPDYEDAYAALAAIQYGTGKKFQAADTFDKLCELDYGLCEAYSNINIVLGRWPKRAIRSYKEFLESYLKDRKQPALI
ncbi:hypothetical protein AAMO2058_000750500 [Amorphochlora amoebiformis]